MKKLLGIVVVLLLGAVGYVWSGWYPIGADVPHDALTYRVLETLRERSIARAAADLQVPPLDDPQQLLAGGADYDDMCAGCHLKPGKTTSDLAAGLYPQPPNLTRADDHAHDDGDARARQFWIVKHGIKASGMPAWGATHDDARIWAMVAFLQKLPTLTPDQYQILTARDDGEPAAAEPVAASAQEPAAVVDAFAQALATGDTARAAALLDPDVKIFESGGIERSRDEYAAHHLGADAAFLREATVTPLWRTGDANGALAWVGSESRIAAVSKGKPVKLLNTESMILKMTPDGWRIVHIHWSSRPDKTGEK